MSFAPRHRKLGVAAALLTPLFMGMAPIFGKLALRSGIDAYTLAALRTCLAALLLWFVYGLFFRQYTFIFPAGVLGTLAVGGVNGVGSLLYYNGLLLLDDASLAQLLSMLYVIFVMLFTRIYGQHISWLSILRAALALVSVYFLTSGVVATGGVVHWLGVALMIGGAFMYALHVVLSQRVMFEMPAPTMALYALTFMGATVLLARLVMGGIMPMTWEPTESYGWWFILGLTAVTALSRVTLFSGVRSLGPLQTSLLNMAEMGVTLVVAFVWLHERMAPEQWIGVLILALSVFLSRWDTEVGDHVYRPLPRPSLFGGRPVEDDGPVAPGDFATVTRLYRRKPRSAQSHSEPTHPVR